MDREEHLDVVDHSQDVKEDVVPPGRGPVGPPERVQVGAEELHVGPQGSEGLLPRYELCRGGRESLVRDLNPLER
ncbi:uncharacterised protein [Saccharolobus solfataricus]|uniref:Uncharacterized protein n=1 Tax=Saccharolobus solfataricus TaxID=2287 RepID=A0A157T201_SACSO|nr:uncharacterised protein [Saccharolobus solfataricus]